MRGIFPGMTSEFEKDLTHVLNKHSIENGSNTPDFILAEALVRVLTALDGLVRAREKWYGRNADGGSGPVPVDPSNLLNDAMSEGLRMARKIVNGGLLENPIFEAADRKRFTITEDGEYVLGVLKVGAIWQGRHLDSGSWEIFTGRGDQIFRLENANTWALITFKGTPGWIWRRWPQDGPQPPPLPEEPKDRYEVRVSDEGYNRLGVVRINARGLVFNVITDRGRIVDGTTIDEVRLALAALDEYVADRVEVED